MSTSCCGVFRCCTVTLGARCAVVSLADGALESRCAGRPNLRSGDDEGGSRRIFNRTFAVTGVLNAFTLGVAGIVFTSLLTLGKHGAAACAAGRQAHRAPAHSNWRRRCACLITALLASARHRRGVVSDRGHQRVKAFGWRLPLQVFPAELAGLLAVTLFAATLAALLPVIKLARTRPVTLLKIFADER